VVVWVLGLILWAGEYRAHTLAVGDVVFYANGGAYFHVWRWEGNQFVEYEGELSVWVREVNYDPWRRAWVVVLWGLGWGRRVMDWVPISAVIELRNNGNFYGVRVWYGWASFSAIFGANGWNIAFPFEPV
jgi:hypothetical protein